MGLAQFVLEELDMWDTCSLLIDYKNRYYLPFLLFLTDEYCEYNLVAVVLDQV
jgi:hypothetical protein